MCNLYVPLCVRLRSFYQTEWDKVHQTYQEEADKCRMLMEQQVRAQTQHMQSVKYHASCCHSCCADNVSAGPLSQHSDAPPQRPTGAWCDSQNSAFVLPSSQSLTNIHTLPDWVQHTPCICSKNDTDTVDCNNIHNCSMNMDVRLKLLYSRHLHAYATSTLSLPVESIGLMHYSSNRRVTTPAARTHYR